MNDIPPPTQIGENMGAAEEELNEVARGIIDEALTEIKRQYDADGENPKAYHNTIHTREVMERLDQLIKATDWNEVFQNLAATENLGDLENLPHDQRMNSLKRALKMAAAAHDIIQSHPPDQSRNELESSNWLAAQMEGEFFQTEIDWAKTAILSTITKIEGETPDQRHLKQNVPENAHPLTRFCAQLLCDADLGNLGSDWDVYWRSVTALFKEIYPQATLQNWSNFLNLQTALLQNHRYNTEAGEKLFSPVNRERNKQRVEALMRDEERLRESFGEASK